MAKPRKVSGEAGQKPTQAQVARLAGVDTSTVNKILNGRSSGTFSPKTTRRVLRVAREIGYDFGRLKHSHRRSQPRKESSFRAEVRLLLEGGKPYDLGMVTLRDLSLSGARATDLALTREALPVLPFSAVLRVMEGPLEGSELAGTVVRVSYSGSVSLGIRFSDLSAPVRGLLRNVLERLR